MSFDQAISEAWHKAALDLGIRVIAPFDLKLADGATGLCEVYLPDFGGQKGALVFSMDNGVNLEAQRQGYWISRLGQTYASYDRQRFIETLNDWGWFGAADGAPSWYTGRAWGENAIVIAVDGPAASGKGTLARRLARHFNFAHMDSGALYRLTALSVLDSGGDPANEQDAVRGARGIDLTRAGDPAIRTAEIGIAASKVSAIPAVRAALHDFQTGFLAHPPGGSLGAVMDGRDIGTVIAPYAAAKLFIDAAPEVRAHRRWLELKQLGTEKPLGTLLAEIQARDHADKTRAISPLRRAADADLLDTSNLDIDAAFAAALALVEPRVLSKLKGRAQGPP